MRKGKKKSSKIRYEESKRMGKKRGARRMQEIE